MNVAAVARITAKNRGRGAAFGNPLILGESHDSAGKKIGIFTLQPGHGGLVIDPCIF
jgi:hypothetical protein